MQSSSLARSPLSHLPSGESASMVSSSAGRTGRSTVTGNRDRYRLGLSTRGDSRSQYWRKRMAGLSRFRARPRGKFVRSQPTDSSSGGSSFGSRTYSFTAPDDGQHVSVTVRYDADGSVTSVVYGEPEEGSSGWSNSIRRMRSRRPAWFGPTSSKLSSRASRSTATADRTRVSRSPLLPLVEGISAGY